MRDSDLTMICINCCAPTESLYIVYANQHIQLTECRKCVQEVDKYVEINNVLLFIDLLLLKPGAYRHLVYNSLELTLSQYPDPQLYETETAADLSVARQSQLFMKNMQIWCRKFDTLNRFWIILFTFEIYLKWVVEDEKYSKQIAHSISPCPSFMTMIHQNNILYQYFYFAIYSLLDICIFHYFIQFCILRLCNWGRNINNAQYIISYTILLSYGAKIFPILMIIWPYDTLLSLNIIKYVANLYIIESLKIVTNLPYKTIVSIFALALVARLLIVKPLLFLILTNGNLLQTKLFLNFELVSLLNSLNIQSIYDI